MDILDLIFFTMLIADDLYQYTIINQSDFFLRSTKMGQKKIITVKCTHTIYTLHEH